MTNMRNVSPFRVVNDRAWVEAAEEDGYLFLPGLLTCDDVIAVRKAVTTVASRHGLLQFGTLPDHGIAAQGKFMADGDTTSEYRAYYTALLSQRIVHALALQPVLNNALAVVIGESVFAHPRNIVRTFFPGSSKITTGPHQDHRPIKGTTEVWTAWIPLGDCPEPLGGLAVVPGSHRTGLKEVPKGTIYFDLGDTVDWRWNPMHCGDVLLFHSLTVHQGRENTTADRIRFSCDFRYQGLTEPVHEDSLLPHMRWSTWEELYSGWPRCDPLRFYWKSYNLDVLTNDHHDSV